MEESGNGNSWIRKAVEVRDRLTEGAQAGGPTTFIDQGADFQGVLRLDDGARIDADFRGEILSSGSVYVGESAAVLADIRAREVVVAGVVSGKVVARRELVLRATGRVQGEVETASLVVERGAMLNANTTMSNPALRHTTEEAAEPKASPSPAAEPQPAAPDSAPL